MDRRNALILIAATACLAACSGMPRAPARPVAAGPPGTRPLPHDDDPGDPLEAMLAADPDPRRNDVVTVALSQVGTPYLWGGGSPVIGFDCSGLVAYVFQQAVHLKLPRVSYDQARFTSAIASDELRAADLLFYNTLGQEFSHVGIYIGHRRFVHAPASGALVRIERMTSEYWRTRYDGARRVLT